jgi:hypothetical protein
MPVSDSSDLLGAAKADIQSVHDLTSDFFCSILRFLTFGRVRALDKMAFVRMIAQPAILPMQIIERTFDSIWNHVAVESDPDISSCIWLLIAIWALETSSQSLFTRIFNGVNSMPHARNASAILSVLGRSLQINTGSSSDIFSLCATNSPCFVVLGFTLLPKVLTEAPIPDGFRLATGESFREFLKRIVTGIGSTLAGGSSGFLPEWAVRESHMFVVLELISFLRLMLQPSSGYRPTVTEILHSSFSRDDKVSLIGALAVLGKRIIPVQHDESGIIGSPDQEQLWPAARVSTHPANFSLAPVEAQLLCILLTKPSFDSAVDIAITVHAASFLAVTIQSAPNMSVFLREADLNEFAEIACRTSNLKRFRAIPEIAHYIGGALQRRRAAPVSDNWSFVAISGGSANQNSCQSLDWCPGISRFPMNTISRSN